MALHRKVAKPVEPLDVDKIEHRSVIDPIFARAGEAAGAREDALAVWAGLRVAPARRSRAVGRQV